MSEKLELSFEEQLKKLQKEFNENNIKIDQIKQKNTLQSTRIDELTTINDDLRIKYSILHEEYIKTGEMSSEHRDENIGLLKFKVERRNSLKEEFGAWWYDFSTIESGWKYFKKHTIPWNQISIAAIIISVVFMFTINPSYLKTINNFFSTPQNQYFLIAIAIISVIGIYYYYDKRKKK